MDMDGTERTKEELRKARQELEGSAMSMEEVRTIGLVIIDALLALITIVSKPQKWLGMPMPIAMMLIAMTFGLIMFLGFADNGDALIQFLNDLVGGLP